MTKKTKWAYLGEVPVEEFGKLVANFAEIVGIGTIEKEGETLIPYVRVLAQRGT